MGYGQMCVPHIVFIQYMRAKRRIHTDSLDPQGRVRVGIRRSGGHRGDDGRARAHVGHGRGAGAFLLLLCRSVVHGMTKHAEAGNYL